MFEQIIEKIKGFLLKPVETFQKSREDEVVPALSYFVVLLIIFGVLSAIVSAAGIMKNPIPSMLKPVLGTGDPVVVFITVFFSVILFWLFLILVWGLVLHIFAYLVGGRKGLWNTEKAVIYGSTPFLLIGWIPVIGPVIGGLWTIVLEILGIRELQELSTTKAILALVIPVAILFVVLILILAWLFVAIVTSGMVPTQYTQF
jgi:hypothetical protein